jgi:hypothetical protein
MTDRLFDLIALLIIGGLFAWREYQHHRQITEMANRLQAGTLQDYAVFKPQLEQTPRPRKRKDHTPPPEEQHTPSIDPAELDTIRSETQHTADALLP